MDRERTIHMDFFLPRASKTMYQKKSFIKCLRKEMHLHRSCSRVALAPCTLYRRAASIVYTDVVLMDTKPMSHTDNVH